MIVLCAHAQIGLEVKRLLERLQSQVDRTESSASRSQTVVNVRRFRLTLQSSFKHLLRCYILAAVEFDHATIVKRVGIARQNALRSQTRLRNREIRPSASCDFRNLRVLVYENSKLIARLSKPSSDKLLVRTFKSDKCR